MCGSPKQHNHHLVFGRQNRKIADRFELIMPLCMECHDFIHKNAKAGTLSKIIGQLEFEKKQIAKGLSEEDARESFRKTFGQSYL